MIMHQIFSRLPGTVLAISYLCLLLISCNGESVKLEEYAFTGTTMGTSYHITIAGELIGATERSEIAARVDSFLFEYNQILSTYDPNSEISKFNATLSINPIPVSDEFAHVVQTGQDLCMKSDGAFDITVMPIVNFFGFGAEPGEDRFPNVEEIDLWLALTGCDKIVVDNGSIAKTDPRVSIDLSAIAKGDAADHLSDFLHDLGYDNLFVEIGGEIKTLGLNKYEKEWKIGIDRPTFGGAPGADLQHIIQLSNLGVATSGDYRNYREVQGARISHMIDPRSGSPISHNLASVTVIADDCMIADGLATAVMIMGQEDGLPWLEAYPDAEGLLVTRESEDVFREYMTSGFEQYLAN